MKILFLGAPGSGKSTQGQILAENKGWKWVSPGQMFRESGDPEILEVIKTARLVPDGIVIKMVIDAIKDLDDVILDGYPRNLKQCESLVENQIGIDAIVEIVVPEEELIKRSLARGRAQDTAEVVKERIGMYQETRNLIVNFFEEKQRVKVLQVNGVGEIEEIARRVKEVVG